MTPARSPLAAALASYDGADFVTRLKARVVLFLAVAIALLLAAVIVYSLVLQASIPETGGRLNWAILGTAIASLLLVLASIALLARGRFSLAGALLLTVLFACAWTVMFVDRSTALIRLDSIVFMIALLFLTPILAGKSVAPIWVSIGLNLALLWIFMFAQGPGMGLDAASFADYLADSTAAMLIAGIASAGVFGIARRALERAELDIAARERTEEELRVLNAELERRVLERTEELSMTNLELQTANAGLSRALQELKAAQEKVLVSEKLSALGRLSAGIAHELNTPLSAIAASNRALMARIGDGLLDISRAASVLKPRSAALIERARASAAPGSGEAFNVDPPEERRRRRTAAAALEAAGVGDADRIAEDLVEYGLSDQLDEAVEVLRGEDAREFLVALRGVVGAQRAAAITENAVGSASRVVAALRSYIGGASAEAARAIDLAEELRSVAELFRNRVKRGIALTIEVPAGLRAFGRAEELTRVWFNLLSNAVQAVGLEGSVRVAAEPEGGFVVVSVEDSGPGIPEAVRGRIFEPFFTTKASGEGTGMGLDIARRLARANGGDVDFESRPGRTVFRVRLPAPEEGGR